MTAPRRLQLRRGNTAAISTYVGAAGELVVNTTTNTLYLHDGSTVGGFATTSNITAINNQISSVNANITLANTGMRGYVDATIAANIANIAVAATYSNVNVKAYTESMGYQNYGNVNVAAYVTTANSAIIGYIDQANTIQSAQVNAANLAITAANLGMKGYVDSVASQSIYGNGNVKSYLTAFNGSIIPSANVTYDLGDNTHRWKDLYLSGNTITLGDATISAIDGKLVTTGATISPLTGAVGFANVVQEVTTDFSTIYDYNKSPGHRYTPNLTTYSSAPIVWDELRTVKIHNNTLSLDTLGGRFANAIATLDSTGNIAGITITDGGIGYDAYYPYYATDPTGYNGVTFPWGGTYDKDASWRRIGLIPTSVADMGNITGIGSGPYGPFERLSGTPIVGTNTYTWTGNTGSTISVTVNWSANAVSYTYTPALPALTSANDWQNWLLDYQANNVDGSALTDDSFAGRSASYVIYEYLNQEALPDNLVYDITNDKWYPNGYNFNFGDVTKTNCFRIYFNRTAIGYAQLENSYGNPVYWLRGLTADSGISTGGDMTVAGDLRVAGDLYVSPTSIYMGNLRISAADGNLTVNTGIKFSDGSVQSSSYSNVQVGVFTNLSNYAYTANVTAANVGLKGYVDQANTIQSNQLTSANLGIVGYIDLANTIQSAQVGAANLAITAANVGMKGYVDNQITTITGSAPAILDTLGELANALGADANLSVTITSQIANVNANITTANLGMRGYVDSQSFYSNVKVATYLPTYSGNISANISKAGHTWTFGTGGTTQFPNSLILAPASQSITMQSDQYSQLMWENANLTVAPNMAINSNFYVTQNNATLDIGYRDGSSTQIIKSWYWNADGTLTLPASSGQIGRDGYSNGIDLYNNNGGTGYVRMNYADQSVIWGDAGGAHVQSAGTYTWDFDTTGNLKLPSGGYILNSDDSIYGGGNYSNVQVATYLPTYSGVVTASNVAVAGNVTAQYLFGNGSQLTGIIAGSSYSNVQVETYLPTYAGTVSASLVNTSGNILSSGLSVFGNTRIGLAGVVSGQFHSVVGNITQTSSGGAVYINTTGNVLAAAVVAGAVTSTGTVAVNAATGITTNQTTFLLANASATTINMGGAATTINLGTTASATGNVFVGGQIGSNAYNLTLRANGTYNIATSINSNGGFNSPPYANQAVIGGTGTGMTANYSATGGYLTTLTIYNSGTGYRNGDVISVPGGIAGNSFVLQNYSPNRVGAFTGTALYTFGIDGNLTVPGNVSATTFVGSGALLTSLPGYAYGNVNVAAYLNATGYNLYSNVNVANYLTTATINTTGNITAGNLITGGALYVANITTTGASGNISGANYITANVILTNGGWGNISQVANIQANAVLVSGNITATYFLGNGALLTGIVAGSSYSNVQVATYLPTYAGTVSASLVNSSGNILSTGLSVFGNTRIGSLATPGALHTIIGNVDVSGAGTEYFNIGGNIMAIQASFGSINTTGNITAQNLIGNISITGNVTGTSANVTLQAGAYTSVFDNQGNVILPNVYVSGNITVGNIAGKTNGFTLGYLEMPQVASGNVTLALSDSGKHFYNTTASPQTITVPSFANVAFGNGTVVSIANQSTSNISVALQSGVILYLAGNATSASRTITSYGVVTLLKVNTNTWFINGSGVA